MEWDIQEHDLDGIKLTTSRRLDAPTVEVSGQVQAGSIDENPKYPDGVAHFFEHLPFEGTENYRGQLREHTAKIGAVINANTGKDRTEYTMSVPRDNWRAGAPIFGDLMLRAVLDAQEAIDEGKTIVNERKWRRIVEFYEGMHAEQLHRFMDHDPRIGVIIGRKDSVLQIRREHLMEFREQFYVRPNTHIIAEGSLPHDEMRDVLAEQFKNMPKGQPTQRAPFKSSGGYSLYPINNFEDTQFSISLPMMLPQITSRELIAINIFSSYFSHPSGPVMKDMRDLNQMVYGIDASWQWNRHYGMYEISAVCSPEETERYAQRLIDHAQNLVMGNFLQNSFEEIKEQISLGIKRFFNNKTALSRDDLFDNYKRIGRPVHPDEFIRDMEAVTLEDVLNISRRLLSQTPTFFAFGLTEGIMPKEKFDEIMAPLTATAGAYLAEPNPPGPLPGAVARLAR